MAGILASSITTTMVSGDTAADNTFDGYITAEAITLSTTPTGATYLWGLAKPTASTARGALSQTDQASVTFTPDAGGYYVITCTVNSTTTYVLRVSVTQVAITTNIETIRYPPKAGAAVAAPPSGRALFFSSDLGAFAEKLPDGSIVNHSAGGSPIAATQASWVIDPAAGDDSNAGSTLGTAIKTHAELMRRLENQTVNQQTTVTIAGDMPTTDPVLVAGFTIGDLGSFRYVGTATSAQTGTVTALTNQDSATNQPAEITDTALSSDWGALGLVGKRVRTTSGTNAGAIAWVAKDLTGKAARVSSWSVADGSVFPVAASFGNVDVDTTDAYVVEDLPLVPILRVDLDVSGESTVNGNATRLIFDSLQINAAFDRFVSLRTSSNSVSAFIACHINGPQTVAASAAFHACRMDPFQTSGTGDSASLEACLVNTRLSLNAGSIVIISGNTLCQGVNRMDVAGRILLNDVGLMDTTNDGVRVSPRGVCRVFGAVWGSGNVGNSWTVQSGGEVVYQSAAVLTEITLTAAGDDATVGGTVRAYAALPYVEAANQAMFVELL